MFSHGVRRSLARRDCVAMPEEWVVIPNGCEGSKISPCGRNDKEADGQDLSVLRHSLRGGR